MDLLITKIKENDNGNGNTDTIQACLQRGIQSGFDNQLEQECQNLICTHPGKNATCSREGVVVTPTPKPTPKTCVECFTSLLTQAHINEVIARVSPIPIGSLATLCSFFEAVQVNSRDF